MFRSEFRLRRLGLRAALVAAMVATLGSVVVVEPAVAKTGPTVKLTADGRASVSVPLGTRVKIAASASGSIPTRQQPVSIEIRGGRQVSGQVQTHRLVRCSSSSCKISATMSNAPVAWYYQAFLLGKSGRTLAKSRYVKVQWTQPPATMATVTDPAGAASEYFGNDPRAGEVTCTGGATQESSHCNVNQNVATGSLLITAAVNGRLPSGDALWLTYDSGNAQDPNYQLCDSSLYQQYGQCVLAVGNPSKAQATIQVPNHKTDYGGMHVLSVTAKVVTSSGDAADALLQIDLCEAGQSPTCG